MIKTLEITRIFFLDSKKRTLKYIFFLSLIDEIVCEKLSFLNKNIMPKIKFVRLQIRWKLGIYDCATRSVTVAISTILLVNPKPVENLICWFWPNFVFHLGLFHQTLMMTISKRSVNKKHEVKNNQWWEMKDKEGVDSQDRIFSVHFSKFWFFFLNLLDLDVEEHGHHFRWRA